MVVGARGSCREAVRSVRVGEAREVGSGGAHMSSGDV